MLFKRMIILIITIAWLTRSIITKRMPELLFVATESIHAPEVQREAIAILVMMTATMRVIHCFVKLRSLMPNSI